jgi:dimethylargininase
MLVALTRALSPRINERELTFIDREPIDVARAAVQHEAYEQRLEAHGCRVVRVEGEPAMPDGVFVEDAAIVLDEIAVITRPGAASRRGETESVARALHRYRAVRSIEAPATIDGGDVLRVGRTLFVGQSRRTSDRAIAQLRELLEPIGYTIVPVPIRDCLHLKSAATYIGNSTILFSPECVEPHLFGAVETVTVDPSEPFAANALALNGTLLMSTSYPRTRRVLEQRGFRVETIENDEMEKAEAGVTCCSIIFQA